MWTVGVAVSGNANGRSLESWTQLGDQQRAEVRRRARADANADADRPVVDRTPRDATTHSLDCFVQPQLW